MNSELEQIKWQLLKNTEGVSPELIERIQSIGKDKNRPLGKINVAYWGVEITRGCNLRCGFCATRLFPKNKFKFMDQETWVYFMELVARLTPYNRVEFSLAGEPTLNPNIYSFLQLGRSISPYTHFQLITNGTTLINKSINYKNLFDAGVNIIYVDMYAPEEIHIELAKKSGYQWYLRRNKTVNDPGAWSYHKNPNLHCIVLQEAPGQWSKNKRKAGYLATFMNNIDWKAAEPYHLYPVEKAPDRRCSQPFRTVNVGYDGAYSFCCFDFMRDVYGKIGSVYDGTSGFFKYWFGNYMQSTRKFLHFKNRNAHPLCSKCAFTSFYGDIPCWTDNCMNTYWDGKKWYFIKDKI